MKTILNLMRKELRSYFNTPIGYVFISVYILLSMSLVIFVGNYYENNQATMNPFFTFQPWVFLFLIPAVGMRLWAEEKNTGTIEYLLTLPINTAQAVLGKFLSGWIFIAIAIFCTFPFIFTVTYLGDPDWGPMICGYLGIFLLAGCYLSITCLTSALTKNQVISFILSAVINFVILLVGWGVFGKVLSGFLPQTIVDAISMYSYNTRFTSMSKGILSIRDLVYFASFIGLILAINVKVIENKTK